MLWLVGSTVIELDIMEILYVLQVFVGVVLMLSTLYMIFKWDVLGKDRS